MLASPLALGKVFFAAEPIEVYFSANLPDALLITIGHIVLCVFVEIDLYMKVQSKGLYINYLQEKIHIWQITHIGLVVLYLFLSLQYYYEGWQNDNSMTTTHDAHVSAVRV